MSILHYDFICYPVRFHTTYQLLSSPPPLLYVPFNPSLDDVSSNPSHNGAEVSFFQQQQLHSSLSSSQDLHLSQQQYTSYPEETQTETTCVDDCMSADGCMEQLQQDQNPPVSNSALPETPPEAPPEATLEVPPPAKTVSSGPTSDESKSKSATSEKSFQCDICQRTFLRRCSLISHLASHSKNRPYQCTFCQRSFAHHTNLVNHMRIHRSEKPYQCDHCHKSFALASIMERHRKTHECDICHKMTFNIKKHKLRYHPNKKPYQCGICKRRFENNLDLAAHKAASHH